MLAAAAIFNGRAEFAGFRDGSADEPEKVLSIWAADAGGMGALKDRIRKLILAFEPDRLVTFDRRHGCTWHADHRALAMLVQSLALPVPVTLVQSRFDFRAPLHIPSGSRKARRIDVRSTWDSLVRVVECHPSQFDPRIVALFREAPADQRLVWLSDVGRFHGLSYLAGNLVRRWQLLRSHLRRAVKPASPR